MINKNTATNSGRPALGKGLASLLSNAAPAGIARNVVADLSSLPKPPPLQGSAGEESVVARDRIPGITLVDVDSITPNQYQPRRDFDVAALEELADSIKANGIIQPLVVRRGADGRLLLIAGERRLRAAKLAGLKQVPVVLRKSSDKEALEIALIENVQREDLNCIDIALSYFQLMEDFHLTQEEMAKRVGKDRTSIANHLRLLKLPEAVIGDLRIGKLSFGHGRALLSLTDPAQREGLRQKILTQNLSVRETEKLVAQLLSGSVAVKKEKNKKEENLAEQEALGDLAERIKRALGTKVHFKGDALRGTIHIEYFSREDLERLTEQLLR